MKGLLRQAAEREKRQLEEIERLKTRVRAMVEVDARWGGDHIPNLHFSAGFCLYLIIVIIYKFIVLLLIFFFLSHSL